MQYELEVLDELISDTLCPKDNQLLPTNDQTTNWIKLIISEEEVARKKIRKMISSLVQEEEKKLYVHHHQKCITRLVDMTFRALNLKDVNDVLLTWKENNLDRLYKTAYQELNELLTWLKEHYATYFDFKFIMPDGYKWLQVKKIANNLKILKKYLHTVEAPKDFIALICQPFERFIEPKFETDYAAFDYLQELQNELWCVAKLKADDAVERMITKLFYLNFNSTLFYNYYIQYLQMEASKMETPSGLIEYYLLVIKSLNQIYVKPNCSYVPQLDSIRDQVAFWITEDLHYLNKKCLPALIVPNELAKDVNKKIHVNLTVTDLAFSIKLLMGDVILHSNYSEVIEKVAKNFRTNRSESLSNSHTYNEGYNITPGTKEKIKSLLLKMARKVNEI